MGMYTQIFFASKIKKEIPQETIDLLNFMANNRGAKLPEVLPSHELFKCEDQRWKGLLFHGDSYYFDADSHTSFRYDDISNQYYLTVLSNLKNYENEIEKFVDWIRPYLDKNSGDFLGFTRYEEYEEPTLIYY